VSRREKLETEIARLVLLAEAASSCNAGEPDDLHCAAINRMADEVREELRALGSDETTGVVASSSIVLSDEIRCSIPAAAEPTEIGIPSAAFLFYLIMDYQNADAIVGDLEEGHKALLKKFGRRHANFWCSYQTLLSIASVAWVRLKEVAGEYIDLLSEVVIHFAFLTLFSMLSVGLDAIVERFHAHGVELVVFRALQAVFGASTIGPTVIWLVRDLKRLASGNE